MFPTATEFLIGTYTFIWHHFFTQRLTSRSGHWPCLLSSYKKKGGKERERDGKSCTEPRHSKKISSSIEGQEKKSGFVSDRTKCKRKGRRFSLGAAFCDCLSICFSGVVSCKCLHLLLNYFVCNSI